MERNLSPEAARLALTNASWRPEQAGVLDAWEKVTNTVPGMNRTTAFSFVSVVGSAPICP